MFQKISVFFFSFFRLCVCVVSAKMDWLSYFWPIIIMPEIFYRNFMSSIISGIKQTRRTQPNQLSFGCRRHAIASYVTQAHTHNTPFLRLPISTVCGCARDFLFHFIRFSIFVFADAEVVCASHTNKFVPLKSIRGAWAHHVTITDCIFRIHI